MSLSQLLRESEIDSYLTGNPQVTYFKSVYRRHTPFYKGLQTYQEHNINDNRSVKEPLSYGTYDLITNIFLENKITGMTGTNKIYANIGNNIINEIKFDVGGNTIFQTYGLYMEARSELDNPYVPSVVNSHSVPSVLALNGSNIMCNTGSQYNVQTMAGGVSGSNSNASSTDTFYTYPDFYFCRDYGNSFPICALNNSEVELNISYREISEIMSSTATLTSTVQVEYINLSEDEKMRFINNTEMYIFYDIIDHTSTNSDTEINFPLRQIFFVGNNNSITNASETVSLSTPASLKNSMTDTNIKINNKNLYETTETLSIFTKQNLNSMYPGYGRELIVSPTESVGYLDSIGVYSFCLDTTNTPSGHLSANIPINITGINNTANIYLEVIKYYRIKGGQLGLMYT